MMKVFLLGALALMAMSPVTPASASILGDLADECMVAVEANDDVAFKAAADAIRKRSDVFDTKALLRAEECLSRGYGEPWEYWLPASAFMTSAEVQNRLAGVAADKAAKALSEALAKVAAERVEAERIANAARVAEMVYASCSTLLGQDQVAAMTNPTCVDSFLANGLPAQ